MTKPLRGGACPKKRGGRYIYEPYVYIACGVRHAAYIVQLKTAVCRSSIAAAVEPPTRMYVALSIVPGKVVRYTVTLRVHVCLCLQNDNTRRATALLVYPSYSYDMLVDFIEQTMGASNFLRVLWPPSVARSNCCCT